MSYNISNSGKSISITPFAHYRFDNLDTNLIGTTLSAIDDQSGNNRHAVTMDAASPMIASAGWRSLPDDMTSIRFDGRDRANLVHQIVEADQPSQLTGTVTVVVVAGPERVWSGQPGYGFSGFVAGFDGGWYQGNNTYCAITSYSGQLNARCHYPGRFGWIGIKNETYKQSGPQAYVFERGDFGDTSLSTDLQYGQPGSYQQGGYIQDWNLVHDKKDSTTHFTFLDGTNYLDYDLYNKTAAQRKYSDIFIGAARDNRHSSYAKTRGRVYEVLMFDTALDQTDRTTITQYIQERYDINNNKIVDDHCARLGFGDEINIRNNGESLNIPVERNMYTGKSFSVDLWFRVNGTRYNAPGAWYRGNFTDPNNKTNKWGTIFIETTNKDGSISTSYNHRCKIAGAAPAKGQSMTMHLANHYQNIGDLVNNKWYNFRWVITNYENKSGTGSYDITWMINGQRVARTNAANYKYWDPKQVVMGLGPSFGSPGDLRANLNYELPETKYTTSTPRPGNSKLVDDDPTNCPNELKIDIAGYSVTLNEFESTEDVDEKLPVRTSAEYQTVYDDISLSAAIDDLFLDTARKPSDILDKTRNEPAVDTLELGAWAYIKAMYNPRPPLSVLGVTQWGPTSSLWNTNLSLASRRIMGDLSWLNYTTANRSFKNTSLSMNGNLINSVDGLQNLYSVTGPGGDTPTTVARNLYLQSNQITSLSPLKDSTFTQYGMWNDVNLSYNRLRNLDGLQNAGEYFNYRNIDYSYNQIENVDALAYTSFRRNGVFRLYGNRINFTSAGGYPFANWTGTQCGLELYQNHITDLRYISASAISTLTFYSQLIGNTQIAGLDDLWIPYCYYIIGKDNNFDSTTISDVNIVDNFNRLEHIDFDSTNLLDISALALLTQEARKASPDHRSIYTGGVYGANEDYTYADGFSAKDIAMFNILQFTWRHPDFRQQYPNVYLSKTKKFGPNYEYYPLTFPWEQQTETPTYRSTSLDRTNGLTLRYNQGYRIFTNRHLKLNNVPIHDTRIFKYAFHGIRGWYNPNSNHHYAEFMRCDMSSGPNTTGTFKNWSKLQRMSLQQNQLTNLDDWFVDSGFHDSPDADDRSFWQTRRSYEYLYLSYNNISDLSFMLKKNFAGVKYLELSNNPITYEEVDRIADDLITLKQNGDIDLIQVDMYYTTWDLEYIGYNSGYWDNAAYYRAGTVEDSYYGGGPGGYYAYPLSGDGQGNSALYSKKCRALGWQGQKYEDGYTTEALLRKRLLDAGINFRFHWNGGDWINGLGSSTSWPDGDADWSNHHEIRRNHYRWGHDNTAGRLILTQTDTTENASNELTITMSNSDDMYPGDTLLLYGSGNSFKSLPMASNNNYPVGGSLGSVFGGSGVWDRTAGTLKLTVAAGQTMTHQQLYELKWTITNPSYDDDYNGHADFNEQKWRSGRYLYISAEDRHGVNRSDDQLTYANSVIGPTTQ